MNNLVGIKLPIQKTPKVFFIKGIFKKDVMEIDSMFEQQIMEELEEPIEVTPTNIFTKLPINFTSLETWPRKCNLWCWNCHLTFETIPVFIPKSIEPLKDIYNIGVHGVFCSFKCANNHINLYYPNVNKNIEWKNKLNFLHKIMYNSDYKENSVVPSLYNLDRYGGNMSIHEFKKNIKSN